MKLLPNNPHSIYTTTADTLKARWKNVTYGCLKRNETQETRFFYKVLPVLSYHINCPANNMNI